MSISTVRSWPNRNRSSPTAPRTLRDAVLIIGFAALGVAGAELCLLSEVEPPASWVAALIPGVALIYVGTGLAAWLRRPSSRLGFLMVATGAAWFLAGTLNLSSPALGVVGTVSQALPLALIVHLLLAFPSGRLHGLREKAVAVAGYGVCLILQAPIYLFAPAGPLAIADRPELVTAGRTIQQIAATIVVLSAGWLIWKRTRPMDLERRRVIAPLTVYGIFALLMMLVSRAIADRFGGGGLTLPTVQFVLLALVPVGFLIATLRGGFARSGDIAELGSWLGHDDAGRPELREALAATLGDPSIDLLYSLPDQQIMVDSQAVVVDPPASGTQRGMVEVELSGKTVGAIVYDRVTLDNPEEIREAGRVIALALDRQRLTVELRASRSRIAAAADDERRRIARDLHDGLQARLVFLAVQAGTGSPSAEIRTGIESAIDELRELVDGVMPAQLAERGLPAAVRDLADRLPIPVELEVDGLEQRLAPEVETAAFFVISEAVTNSVKHSNSGKLLISLSRADGQLWIEVDDDGSGHATTGRGLRGMADRVEALGGDFLLGDTTTGGTSVKAAIPCG